MELINYLSSDGDFAASSDTRQPSRAETPISVVCSSCQLLLFASVLGEHKKVELHALHRYMQCYLLNLGVGNSEI